MFCIPSGNSQRMGNDAGLQSWPAAPSNLGQTVQNMNSNSKVAEYWSNLEPDRDLAGSFYTSPCMVEYKNRRAFGDEVAPENLKGDSLALDIFLRRYVGDRPIRSVLSLCCGFGKVERYLVKRLKTVENCLGLDLAEGALREAAKRAESEGLSIRYEIADLNSYQWPTEAYDLIIANGALHHLTNLEAVIPGMRQALRPKGVLYCCEYVGPSHQDQSVRQVELINAAKFLLPEEWRDLRGAPYLGAEWKWKLASKVANLHRKTVAETGPLWKKLAINFGKTFLTPGKGSLGFGVVHVSPKEHLLAVDPSEGVRAAEIVPIMKRSFPDAEVRNFGGGLVQFVLGPAFYARFDPNLPAHRAYLEMLFGLEEFYSKTGEIPEENAFIFAQKD